MVSEITDYCYLIFQALWKTELNLENGINPFIQFYKIYVYYLAAKIFT